jgi:hypothetical protein
LTPFSLLGPLEIAHTVCAVVVDVKFNHPIYNAVGSVKANFSAHFF